MAQRNSQRFQFWHLLIADWKQSGQSVAAFCRQRGVCKSGFYRWQHIFADEGSTPTPATPSFVPVRVIADAVVEVILPSGLQLRLPLSADAQQVARLVLALGATPC
ncbi:MAG TPA: hypothetical protein VGI99_08665 [Gemmataceae bacterium]|jgi:hypothetical protein